VPHATYHVSARINRREMALDPPWTKKLFLSVLERAKKRYPFKVLNFSIMGNHFHLILEPLKDANLSRIMQWTLSMFAQSYNRLQGLTGHVWGERFFSRAIKSIREYVRVFDYVDNNPLEAGLVSFLPDWLFGGL